MGKRPQHNQKMKKATRPRDTRDTRDRRQLVRLDWDFSRLLDWPEDDLRKVWTWELEREWGSGNRPYLLEWEWQELAKPRKHSPILKSYGFEELAEDVKEGAAWIRSGKNDFTTIQAIEIDWTQSETELVEAFRNWLRDGRHPFHTDYETHAKHLAGPKRGRRKTAGLLAWLRDLAIHRIGAAGFTRKEGLAMLGIKHMSAPNWEHAQARTRERIEKHAQKLRSLALNMSRVDPARSSPNWRDYFTHL